MGRVKEERGETEHLFVKDMDPELHAKFRSHCIKLGMSIRGRIIQLMEDERPTNPDKKPDTIKGFNLNIRSIPEDVKRKFRIRCKKEKLGIAAGIIKLIKEDCNEEESKAKSRRSERKRLRPDGSISEVGSKARMEGG